MVSVQIDEKEVLKLAKVEIERVIKEVDAELVFWDRQELMKRTCMSWVFILDQFFYDERFPKHKINKKWYFPVREARAFLELWLSEQKTR
jgi:hypothetical protein